MEASAPDRPLELGEADKVLQEKVWQEAIDWVTKEVELPLFVARKSGVRQAMFLPRSVSLGE